MNKLPHITIPEDYNPLIPPEDREWEDYDITEEDVNNHPFLKEFKEHKNAYHILMHKVDPKIQISDCWGDSFTYDMNIKKIIDYGLGF